MAELYQTVKEMFVHQMSVYLVIKVRVSKLLLSLLLLHLLASSRVALLKSFDTKLHIVPLS